MKRQPLHTLNHELKSAGASDSEVHELSAIAHNLARLKHPAPQPPKAVVKSTSQSQWKLLVPAGLTAFAGIAIGVAMVITAQTVLPGSLLYPVQKFSDSVAISISPDYRGIVMMKRAQEVKQLIAEHASSKTVLATLADYQTEAASYKSAATNYAAFEYCKSNLRQAAARAPSSERQAINNTLASLNDV